MSDSKRDAIVAIDEINTILKFDGTGDCKKFHKKFDTCMRERGYGGIVNIDNYEVPLRPDDAFARIENGVYNRNDGGDIATYNKTNGHFLNRCDVVLACYKRALSQSIRFYLVMTFPEEYDVANKQNLDVIRNEVMRKYGGWTDTKGKRNYADMLAIPNIVDIESADTAFATLQTLIEERAGWNRKEEVYGDNFYRVWLKDHIKNWPRLLTIHTDMELHETVTFAEGQALVMTLVDIDREALGLQTSTAQHIKAITASQQPPTSFTFSGNTVEEFEAMRVNYQPGQGRAGDGLCFNCKQPGHLARDCMVQRWNAQYQQAPRASFPQQRSRAVFSQQPPRGAYQQKPSRGAYQQQPSSTTYPLQTPRPEYTRKSSQQLQPTSQQMQMFQSFMQQQLAEQQCRKRAVPIDENRAGQHPVKYARKPEWPPRGTGPPRLTGAMAVEQEEEENDYEHPDAKNQQYSAAVGVAQDTMNDENDSGTYFQDDGEGYTSECN